MKLKGTRDHPAITYGYMYPKTFVWIDDGIRQDVIAERGTSELPHSGPWKQLKPGPGFDWQQGWSVEDGGAETNHVDKAIVRRNNDTYTVLHVTRQPFDAQGKFCG